MQIINRPWGWMVKLIHTNRFWLKIILVDTRTSLQYHLNRTEYHISLFGIKKVLPLERHRMTHGLYIEIATGFPSEDDIVRIDDDFGRA